MNKLKLATKLWAAVAVLMVSLMAIVGWAGVASKRSQADVSAATAQAEAKRDAARRWAGMTETNVVRVLASAISTDPVVEAHFKPLIGSTIAQIDEVYKGIEAMDLSDADRAQMKKVADERRVVLESLARLRELKAAGDMPAVKTELDQRFTPLIETYLGSLRQFAAMQDEAVEAVRIASRANSNRIVGTAAVLLGLVVLCAVIGARYLIASIREPLDAAVALARRIADGDLTHTMTVDRQDEFGDLLRALGTMNQALERTVSEVRSSTENISTASGEIAQGNQDLSSRTEATASNLQQTASSMEQITGTVKQSAETARQANQLVQAAAQSASQGGEIVHQVVDNMAQISESSRKIADIIGVIDGIAFQTNILALNAAVEAARAGEQGRGFAVVAGEVRNLAQRSAQAAREIKSLITASVERVEGGTELVERAGAAMSEIVASVRRVSDMMGEITASATEQSEGIAQVNVAVTQLDQMTQQNAALVEESAAAAASMNDQARRLAQTVAFFRLGQLGMRAA
ncbi:methyl-accepting chemotaxis protein [Caldimonas caldifontis]|uniref:Methyl-accepting chemotaxis protein n=1 Tax=Caldimonas caldifontis TaxID=1452508 RepID=A0A2S5SR41_9BURK|nr:methyl-accepting chemotaxis protein [Caldimonas caldifontis]PPE65190.1 methyl-accepting chemotaxis protein [Caldimonas caldifontis]